MDREARNKIIIDNMNLVYYVANYYRNSNIEFDDIIGYGFEGLVKCVDKYDSTKSQFSTFAFRCIQNEILMAFNKENRQNKIMKHYENSVPEYSTTDYNPEVIYLKKEEVEEVTKSVNELDEIEYKIITLRYGINGHDVLKQSQIGKMLNFSQSYTSKIEKKILKKLKK